MFKRVALEISLKPFKKTDDEYIDGVCNKIFTDWYNLLKNREEIDIMLWVGDGSELFDYTGDMKKSFDWAKYIGTANKPLISSEDDPATTPHNKKQLYISNPPEFTYEILKKIIDTIRNKATRFFPHSKILIGETIDIGPEFAVSDFKYNRHIEICSEPNSAGLRFVDSTALLSADNYPYAGFPKGIPEGTPLGLFIGKQTQCFLRDMELDYIWLSNGLGFSSNPWETSGKIFDGEKFHPEKLSSTKNAVMQFWSDFREGCPSYPVRVRGTNYSAGIDYATDGVPLYEIYKSSLNITPPPNSPWAAINDDYGLEIMAHLTRICELPEDSFMFRYYIHDPWWMNSPWYDRYNGQASDIYLPLAVTRIDKDGNIKSADQLNILSIDNSRGEMPDACVNEPLPHLLKAEKNSPDKIPMIVWVYPLREYTTTNDENLLAEMFYGDRYIADAINNGFPLSCVVSADNFLNHPIALYEGAILLSPYQPNKAVRDKLKEFSSNGGNVISYGTEQYFKNIIGRKINVLSSPDCIRETLADFGYFIDFETKPSAKKKITLAVSRTDNAYMFSVYNPHATTDTFLKFPLGAPVLLGGETEIRDGKSVYRFARCEHRECRIFIKQESGVVSALENAPVNNKYRRKIRLSGLENATVYVFPENECIDGTVISFVGHFSDAAPNPDSAWKKENSIYGTYYKAEGITGDRLIFMPNKKTY